MGHLAWKCDNILVKAAFTSIIHSICGLRIVKKVLFPLWMSACNLSIRDICPSGLSELLAPTEGQEAQQGWALPQFTVLIIGRQSWSSGMHAFNHSCPLCFCSGSFLSGAPGASQVPELIAATCSSSSAHSLVSAPALKLCPWCQPLPDLQRFATVEDPASQLFLPKCLFPIGFPAALPVLPRTAPLPGLLHPVASQQPN